jgi:archaemetzincin
MKREILLVPMGKILPEVCDWLLNDLPPVLGCACRVAPASPHPAYAWNARRGQYLPEVILTQVKGKAATNALAIADLDLYVPDLNFVFGLADRPGGRAIIALPRLRQSFYGLRDDVILFHKRAIKEAVHELGHVCGLEHCSDRRCVMVFSNSLADTDYKGSEFCPKCRARVKR